MLKATAANSSQPLSMTGLYTGMCSTDAESLAGGFTYVYNMPALVATLMGRDAVVIH